MKTISLIIVVMLFGITGLLAQSVKTEKFAVKGNCGMCESRIEKAAKAIDGVSSADWNQETKEISVSFDSEKTDVVKIQKAIAKVGHDTDKYKAEDKVYDALPGCCQYDRTK